MSPPPELAAALRLETEHLRDRLAELAEEVAPGRGEQLGEQLLLVVTGDLAMRLRTPGRSTDVARAVAATLVRAA